MPMLEIDTTWADFPDNSTYHTIWTGSITCRYMRVQAARLTCCSDLSIDLRATYTYFGSNDTFINGLFTSNFHYEEDDFCDYIDIDFGVVNYVTLNSLRIGNSSNLGYCDSSERIRMKICIELYNGDNNNCVHDSNPNNSRVELTLSYS